MEQVSSSGFLRWKRRFIECTRHAAILICLIQAAGVLPAQEPLEYQVKAAFLLNFTKFIEWPATAFRNADAPIAICVLGDNPFGRALDQIVRDEMVNGRPVSVAYIREATPPQSCQVLFSNGPAKDIKTLSDSGPGVLTVGEGPAFLRDGGMIAFVIENNRVRFEINQAAAERAGLKLSSKLLSVAKSVGRVEK
jgi:hypothetical protein